MGSFKDSQKTFLTFLFFSIPGPYTPTTTTFSPATFILIHIILELTHLYSVTLPHNLPLTTTATPSRAPLALSDTPDTITFSPSHSRSPVPFTFVSLRTKTSIFLSLNISTIMHLFSSELHPRTFRVPTIRRRWRSCPLFFLSVFFAR